MSACNKSPHSHYTHTHPFNNPYSRTTHVSRYQKGRTNLDFTEARDSEWQWHQLGHMQVCTLLQTDNHASNPPLSFYRPDALPAAQPTASKHINRSIIRPHRSTQRMQFRVCPSVCFCAFPTKTVESINMHLEKTCTVLRNHVLDKKGKGSPYSSITGRRVPELIPVLGSQPAGDVSHKPGGRLPLLSARPAITPATLNRAATNFAAW